MSAADGNFFQQPMVFSNLGGFCPVSLAAADSNFVSARGAPANTPTRIASQRRDAAKEQTHHEGGTTRALLSVRSAGARSGAGCSEPSIGYARDAATRNEPERRMAQPSAAAMGREKKAQLSHAPEGSPAMNIGEGGDDSKRGDDGGESGGYLGAKATRRVEHSGIAQTRMRWVGIAQMGWYCEV